MRLRDGSAGVRAARTAFRGAGAAVPGPLYRRRCGLQLPDESAPRRRRRDPFIEPEHPGGIVAFGSVGYALGNGMPVRNRGQLSPRQHQPRRAGPVSPPRGRCTPTPPWRTRCSTWISACRGCTPISAAASATRGPTWTASFGHDCGAAVRRGTVSGTKGGFRLPGHRWPGVPDTQTCLACHSPPNTASSASPAARHSPHLAARHAFPLPS